MEAHRTANLVAWLRASRDADQEETDRYVAQIAASEDELQELEAAVAVQRRKIWSMQLEHSENANRRQEVVDAIRADMDQIKKCPSEAAERDQQLAMLEEQYRREREKRAVLYRSLKGMRNRIDFVYKEHRRIVNEEVALFHEHMQRQAQG